MLVEVETLMLFGGCLANNGINILNNEKILSTATIQAVNPIIMTCGMGNHVGHFVEETGMPNISGKSGAFLSIIPGLGALVSYSPKLDQNENSIKGVAFIEYLGQIYSEFNLFYKDVSKLQLTTFYYQMQIDTIVQA